VKILLSDGSSPTSRQVAGLLSLAGHRVEVLSPDPVCLCRFTRHVRRVHRVPGFGAEPLGWLDAALGVYHSGRFDALFPTQDQVVALSHSAGRLEAEGVRTAVPALEAVRAVQDKVTASATLGALRIPRPHTAFVGAAEELRAWRSFPVYIKVPISAAAAGARRVESAAALGGVATELEAGGFFARGAVIAEEAAAGPLVMVQSVFAGGKMVAAHASLRVREGARGSATHKRSVDDPASVIKHLEVLGRSLRWHGALSGDAIITSAGPVFIDVNPYLVEPGNAWRCGVDLAGTLLEVARARIPDPQPAGRPGVATHQLLLAVLGTGAAGRGRRGVAAEIAAALAHAGAYRGSAEELTPVRRDPLAAVPVFAATLAMLIRPALGRRLSAGAVAGHALTPVGWDRLLNVPPD
jgi:hypothetical protein